LSWLSWERTPEQQRQEDFTAGLIRLRHEHPIFRRPKFFQGRKIRGTGAKDLLWIDSDGTEMTDEGWNHSFIRCMGIVLVGFAEDIRDYFGQPVQDDTFMLLFNAHHEPVKFVLAGQQGVTWERHRRYARRSGVPRGADDAFRRRRTGTRRRVRCQSSNWATARRSRRAAPPGNSARNWWKRNRRAKNE
jgi:isoamylase